MFVLLIFVSSDSTFTTTRKLPEYLNILGSMSSLWKEAVKDFCIQEEKKLGMSGMLFEAHIIEGWKDVLSDF